MKKKKAEKKKSKPRKMYRNTHVDWRTELGFK